MNPHDYIPTPCHEDWNSMSGNQKKRFCDKCTTHVHDLTDMNTEEILALKTQNGGKLCGSFQLKRPIAIGASLATLALASCNKNTTPPQQNQQSGQPTPTEQKIPNPETPKQVKLDPVMGIIFEPIEPKPSPQPQLLGEVCEPFPVKNTPKHPIKMGKIALPPKEK